MSKTLALAAVCSAATFLAPPVRADYPKSITVEAGKHDRTNVPVVAHLKKTGKANATPTGTFELTDENGKKVYCQVAHHGLVTTRTNEDAPFELHFVVDELKAGEKRTYTWGGSGSAEQSYDWVSEPKTYSELKFGDRPVLRYMQEPLDESRREETYKVFHHVYDPSGQQIVTKGPGGRYTHHRGLFYGFSKTSYGDGKRADTWHCRGHVHLAHHYDAPTLRTTGPVVGRHQVEVDWHGADGEVFAKEQRQMGVYNVPGGTLIEFASLLKPVLGPIKVDGDPQHAGFQFRASNEVAAETKNQTYYVRVDGKGKQGETRNWPGHKDQKDLPWKAMSFVVGGERYTAAYLDHPENPKPSMYSERDYGRFGSYFVAEVTEDDPLLVRYRVWLQHGELEGDDVAALSNDFTDPPKVTVSYE